jgi:hypothetical protein
MFPKGCTRLLTATGRAMRVPYCVVYELQAEKIKAPRLYLPMNAL